MKMLRGVLKFGGVCWEALVTRGGGHNFFLVMNCVIFIFLLITDKKVVSGTEQKLSLLEL